MSRPSNIDLINSIQAEKWTGDNLFDMLQNPGTGSDDPFDLFQDPTLASPPQPAGGSSSALRQAGQASGGASSRPVKTIPPQQLLQDREATGDEDQTL